MTPLSQSHYKALLTAVEMLYRPMSIEQFPGLALSAVRKVLACNTICYNEVDIPDSSMSWITEPADALPGPGLKEMFNRNLHEHPLIAHSGLNDSRSSVKISDFLSQQQFHRLAIYNEYYRPLNVEYQLGTTISINKRQIIAFGLDRDSPDFSEDDRMCLDILRPHLVQAYRNAHTVGLMKHVIEGFGKKLMMVPRSGQIQLNVDDSWRILARYVDTSRASTHIPDILKNWINHERSRYEDEAGDLSQPLPLVISKAGRNLIIHFVWGGKVADQDLLLLEEQNTESIPASSLNSKLTERENEILAWLSQGKTNADIALALSISPRTVKKHLEHIYDKLQVHRRGAAVARSLHL